MERSHHAERERGVALLVVRNSLEHDARVLRAARTLRALGLRTTVLGVMSWTERRALTHQDGIPIRRIGPSSRLAWSVWRQISNLSPRRQAPEPRRDGSPRSRPLRAAARRLLRWATTLAYYRRAIGFVVAVRPDLVHCNDYNTMWIGVAARCLTGSVVIYDSHELWPDRNLRPEPRWWLVLCEAVFVRVAHRVVMTSPAHAEVMARRYRIPEPVVVRNIPVLRRDGRPGGGRENGGPPVAIYVGGLQPGRGLEQSIRALAMVPELRLRLLGPGLPVFKMELEELIRSAGVEDRVEFAPPVPPGDVVNALAGADVGLALFQPTCLSHQLVLPNKLFEYALAGVPVLGSDLPMISRFVEEHGLGTTVDPENPDAIAAKLRELIAPDRTGDYRAAARRAAATLDGSKELEILARVYREALGSASGASSLGSGA